MAFNEIKNFVVGSAVFQVFNYHLTSVLFYFVFNCRGRGQAAFFQNFHPQNHFITTPPPPFYQNLFSPPHFTKNFRISPYVILL